jgi:hypothetical protein
VFPARSLGVRGHCSELRRKIAISEPINWQLATMLPRGNSHADRNFNLAFGGTRATPGQYGQTLFWDMEAQLQSAQCRAV